MWDRLLVDCNIATLEGDGLGVIRNGAIGISDGKIVRVATMTGDAPGPSGTTEIAIERSNGRSDEEVTIRVRDLPFPTLCRLMADGKELALFSTGMLDGNVELTFARRVIVADPGK